MRWTSAWLAALALLAPLLAPDRAGAVQDDAHLWAVGNVSAPLGERFLASLQVQGRFAQDMSELDRVVLRPSLGAKILRDVVASLGYDAHLVEYPRDTWEHRVWQQLAAARQAPGDLDAGVRLRLEQRFLENVDGVAVRFRGQLRVVQPLPISEWQLVGSNETVLGLNSLRRGPDSGFDENRLFAGFGRALGAPGRVEIGYQMRYLDRRREDLIHHTLLISLGFSAR